jgi:drug/metabolite transporter (DMT)-like permease
VDPHRRQDTDPPLALLAAAATGVQVGAAIVATRFVIAETTPAALALMRYAIGVLCLVPPLLAAPRVRFARRDVLPIAVLGVLQFGVLIAILNYAMRFVPSGRAALVFATFPLLTMLFAAAIGRERLSTAKTVGVLLTIAGVGFALGDRVLAGGTGDWRGEVAVLASAAVGAVCSVMYRPYLVRYPALPVGALAMLASVVALALGAAAEGFFVALPQITTRGWAAIVFIGVSSGIGYFLWLWALGRASPTRVTVFLALSPVTAALLGAWFLGEQVSATFVAGLACVATGLWSATRGDIR